MDWESDEIDEGGVEANFVIQIQLISDIILSYLDLPALKSCRLVNKTWNRVSTTNISQRDLCGLKIYQNPYNEFCATHLIPHKPSNKSRPLYLPHLCSILTENQLTPFPCHSFELDGDFDYEDPQSFLDIHGHSITSLKLTCTTETCPTQSSFCHLLLNQTVNLSILDLSDFDDNFSWPSLPSIFLPSIRIFWYKNLDVDNQNYEYKMEVERYSTSHHILLGCPNCIEVKNIHSCHTDLMTQSGRMRLVKSWKFTEWDDLYCEALSKFVVAKPRLTKMTIDITDLTWQRLFCKCEKAVVISKNLIHILNSSQNSLKILEIYPLDQLRFESTNNSSQLIFPVLTKLKILKINLVHLHPGNIFPSGFIPNKFFPGLKIVKLKTRFYSRYYWSKYFPVDILNVVKFESVGRIEIIEQNQKRPTQRRSFGLAKINELFPCVKIIKLQCQDNIEDLLRNIFEIWDGPQLEILMINYCKFGMNDLRLDSTMTGFSPEECKRLKYNLDLDLIEHVASPQYSIVNLSGLKHFKLTIYPDWTQTVIPPISNVSFSYGLSRRENIIVEICME